MLYKSWQGTAYANWSGRLNWGLKRTAATGGRNFQGAICPLGRVWRFISSDAASQNTQTFINTAVGKEEFSWMSRVWSQKRNPYLISKNTKKKHMNLWM